MTLARAYYSYMTIWRNFHFRYSQQRRYYTERVAMLAPSRDLVTDKRVFSTGMLYPDARHTERNFFKQLSHGKIYVPKNETGDKINKTRASIKVIF